jgi:drug/metabolite transporter (DMT)-like permease
MALGSAEVDPVGFTLVRLISGAITLWLIISVRDRKNGRSPRGSWVSAWWLFLYATAFSFAYVDLATGTGALILFIAVQVTMILSGLMSGERPHPLQWFGLMVAMGGFVWLVAPGLSAPSPAGSLIMVVAGIAWGIYSIRGREVPDPVAVTAGNFLLSVPMVAAIAAVMLPTISLSPVGIFLALLSGSLASGLGYVLWYAALRGLTTTRAAIVQLAVPLLAAIGGVVLLSEPVTTRLLISGAAILGGVGIAVTAPRGSVAPKD